MAESLFLVPRRGRGAGEAGPGRGRSDAERATGVGERAPRVTLRPRPERLGSRPETKRRPQPLAVGGADGRSSLPPSFSPFFHEARLPLQA